MPAKSSIPGVEVYFKPNTAQVVLRKEGVERVSEKVLAQNIRFADKTKGNTLAKNCAKPNLPVGKRYKAFKACLFVEGKKLFGKPI